MWKNWFAFTKGEHRAVWILLALIALSLAVRYVRVREHRLQTQIDSLTHLVTSQPLPMHPPITQDKPMDEIPKTSPKKQSVHTAKPPKLVVADSVVSKPEQRPVKFKELTLIELNSADTTQLKQIPGIGSVYARIIVEYRQRLGGYLSVEQIDERKVLREGVYEQISPWLTADSSAIVRINLNKATFKELARHPYIGYERAKIISNYIRKSGPLSSLHPLNLLEGFSKTEISRLEPYVRYK